MELGAWGMEIRRGSEGATKRLRDEGMPIKLSTTCNPLIYCQSKAPFRGCGGQTLKMERRSPPTLPVVISAPDDSVRIYNMLRLELF
jgi:hypothetical protein